MIHKYHQQLYQYVEYYLKKIYKHDVSVLAAVRHVTQNTFMHTRRENVRKCTLDQYFTKMSFKMDNMEQTNNIPS